MGPLPHETCVASRARCPVRKRAPTDAAGPFLAGPHGRRTRRGRIERAQERAPTDAAGPFLAGPHCITPHTRRRRQWVIDGCAVLLRIRNTKGRMAVSPPTHTHTPPPVAGTIRTDPDGRTAVARLATKGAPLERPLRPWRLPDAGKVAAHGLMRPRGHWLTRGWGPCLPGYRGHRLAGSESAPFPQPGGPNQARGTTRSGQGTRPSRDVGGG